MRSYLKKDAVLSTSGVHRYMLSREWNAEDECLPTGRAIFFIGLNPSTADAEYDDPTIRREVDFARMWGYEKLLKGNLFAFRATDPNKLLEVRLDVRCGHRNNEFLFRAMREADTIVAAWGAHPLSRDRGDAIVALVPPGKPVFCLGTTKEGYPRHPLYVKKSQPLEVYRSGRGV